MKTSGIPGKSSPGQVLSLFGRFKSSKVAAEDREQERWTELQGLLLSGDVSFWETEPTT